MKIGLSLSAAQELPSTSYANKIEKAAQDFEAILLESLLRTFGKGLSLSGEGENAGDENYQYLGTQALVSGLAASGGLGIAKMITRNLMKTGTH